MCRKTVKNHVVKNSKLCFILSCPGKEEAKNNKVCSGATGDNLNTILKKSKIVGQVCLAQNPCPFA